MFLAATLSTLATIMTDGRKTRWGILGTGTIASDFARILSHASDAEIAAVGSRSLVSAETFCEPCRAASARSHRSQKVSAEASEREPTAAISASEE